MQPLDGHYVLSAASQWQFPTRVSPKAWCKMVVLPESWSQGVSSKPSTSSECGNSSTLVRFTPEKQVPPLILRGGGRESASADSQCIFTLTPNSYVQRKPGYNKQAWFEENQWREIQIR